MNYTKLPKKALLLLATPVLFSLAVPASKLVAQSQTETKIRLMAEGLRARDSGDLATAKTNFEQLLVLAPNDVTVQRLLSGVNDAIAAGSAASAVAPAAAAPADSEQLVEVVYDPSGRTAAKQKAKAEAAAAKAEAAKEKAAAAAEAPAQEVVVTENAEAAPVDAEAAAKAAADAKAAELAKVEEARVKQLIKTAEAEGRVAKRLARDGNFDAASEQYSAAIRSLPVNTLTAETIEYLQEEQTSLLLQKSQVLLKQGDTVGAQQALDEYIAATSPEGRAARKQAARINQAELFPEIQPIEKVNPEFIAEQKQVASLLAKGRSQYKAGDIDGAQETFRVVETISAENPESKYFLKRISDEKAKLGTLNREKTRSLMIEEVAKGWQRPGVFVEKPQDSRVAQQTGSAAMAAKMDGIIIPSVSFTGVELGRVVSTLSALSAEYDTKSAEDQKGVNLVLGNQLPGASVPPVNITLRNLSLKRILDIITENVGYQVEIQADLVLIKPSGTDVNLVNEQFAVSKSAITRMTGAGSASASTPAASADPFAPAPTGGGGGSGGGESDGIRRFLQAAGVPFDTVPGSSLAYDGASILVTHTSRNIDRIRNILNRYNDVRQVEIEAKFMDVSEGALDELGVNWTAAFSEAGVNYQLASENRSLSSAFTSSASANGGSITSTDALGNPVVTPISSGLPSLPGTVDLGGNASPVAEITSGIIGDVAVTAQLRAIARRQGSDLLSAPKVTVLSGSRATITVAQELRFPQSYGETQSEVGSNGADSGGGAGVTITPGTPEDFSTRNVGVELAVTPTVEEDDYSISLELNPRVTEFEGFVEFGGQSVAVVPGGGLTGATTVIIPSGFYQPIFSVREINTRVTIWDGATLVMGGLTREEVRRVNDKVPILGDIPLLGRAFKSKGESSQKRNLLVFVTANLVSPGGSLKKQELKGVAPSSMFQNPTVVTPGGSEARLRSTVE
ncbi:MAG: type II secretory pathway, component PulD [Opitutaceae bacterium]|jgi:general secretion pathway protein D|nr:type II secretory pathway, component PulD [Opitutaceae bacterium]